MNLQDKNNRRFLCRQKLIPLIKKIVDNTIRNPVEITTKRQGDFVTEIDLEIERKLMEELGMLFPDVGFVSEESISQGKMGLNWIIDPIDGTSNFIYGLQFSTSVALQDSTSGDILMGVVYEPRSDTIYYGVKDCGSYIIAHDKETILKVSEFQNGEGMAFFGMPYDRSKTNKILNTVKKLYPISTDLKRVGPASLDICMVASGRAKMYFELDLQIWDIAAGLLILLEAGGNYMVKDDLSLFYVPSVSKEINALIMCD